MDHFGIGPAMRAMLRTYTQCARGSGRTTSLINSVRDGDRIICALAVERVRLSNLLHQAGRDVEVLDIPPEHSDAVVSLPLRAGRTIFEHTWVEEFYTITLAQAARQIDELQKSASRGADLLGVPVIEPHPNFQWDLT